MDRALMSRATRDEQLYLARLLVGELRQGALEGLMAEALARAAELPIPGLREVGALTNETLFSLTELPRRMAVIGGGPIGCDRIGRWLASGGPERRGAPSF